ncbi:MAG: hypothetical protein ACI8QC_002652 [Planctomycetota bacterium]|jgi:hypothetical protein
MDCLPKCPLPSLRPRLTALVLALVACAPGCRPAKAGPVPLNVLVLTLDDLTPAHLAKEIDTYLPLIERATRFENAHAPSGERGPALEALWFGDSSGAASGLLSFPERLHELGIVSAAIVAAPTGRIPSDLLVRFDRVEALEGDFTDPQLLAGGLTSWLAATDDAGIGSWLLWLHGTVGEAGPAGICELLEQTLAAHPAGPHTIVVLAGLPLGPASTQVPLAIGSPEVGAEWEQAPVQLQDVVPTLAERLSQRLYNEGLAESTGDGISLCAALLGLPIERETTPEGEAE